MPIRCKRLLCPAASSASTLVLALCLTAHSQEHAWQARDASQRTRETKQLAALDPAARSRFDAAEAEMNAALAGLESGKIEETLRRFRAAVTAAETVLPGPSSRRIERLSQLAELHSATYDFASAIQALAQAEEHSTALFGAEHPLSLAVINRMGTLCYHTGQYERAEAKLVQAKDISERLYGPLDIEHLTCASNLASLWHAQGRYGKAQPLLLDVAQRTLQHYGEKHPQYATALNNLAGVDQSLGDFPRAIDRLRQALAIRQETLGSSHEDTLTSLNNLAGLYLQTSQPAEARRLFAEVAEARRARGADDPDYATSLSNLAAAHEALKNLAEAERLSREALQIRERVLGNKHPDVATSLNNLAMLIDSDQRQTEAEALLRRALTIRTEQLGNLHPDYAATLNNLAVHFRDRAQTREAADSYRQALEAQQAIIEATLPALAERQQLSLLGNLRRTLDGYLSVAALSTIPPATAYQHVLWWKGQVLVRQLARRHATTGPAAAPLLDQLREVSGQLAAATLAPATSGDAALRERRLQALSEQREQLQAKIAQLTPASSEQPAASPAELAASLPEGAVLIDFLEYWRTSQNGVPPRIELTAFVIQRDKPIARIDLGPVEPLADLIETWLRTWGAPGKGSDAGANLRDRIWRPLQQHVSSAPIVLYSPDGCLTRLPLAALPGKQPGTYLIEDQTVVVLPVPQLLPRLIATPPAALPRDSSLLLVGDIDYGPPQQPPKDQTAAAPLYFAKLSAARGEILAVRDSFERAFPAAPSPTVLRGMAAGEESFRRACPSHQFIHLVTHGFVSGPPPSAPPFFSEQLCGLALAGANARQNQTADDGILTAAEAAEMDLRSVKLVVLSACETGLGTVAAGEGVLGLQRAFQVAGAQTVIASLWKVDDRATQQMMDNFYERLWSSEGRISRIEALRQAQLAILRGSQDRGVGIVNKKQEEKRVPPYYWAPFVLSGDWR